MLLPTVAILGLGLLMNIAFTNPYTRLHKVCVCVWICQKIDTQCTFLMKTDLFHEFTACIINGRDA